MTMIRFTSASLAALELLASCSSTSTSPPGGRGLGESSASTPLDTLVTASAGGTLATDDGAAVLSVPKGAVSEDVRVRVEVGAAVKETASAIYTYLPNGTTFAVAATISIATTGVVVPVDKELALGAYRKGEWVPLRDARISSGTLEAPVESLGAFALILVSPSGGTACAAECMSRSGAVCCEGCGCQGAVRCTPSCKSGFKWDCEMHCCFDYEAMKCQ